MHLLTTFGDLMHVTRCYQVTYYDNYDMWRIQEFPIGGHGPRGGGGAWTSEVVTFCKFYVKTKESGPLGGCAPGTSPRSANYKLPHLKKRRQDHDTGEMNCAVGCLMTIHTNITAISFRLIAMRLG